MKINVTALGLPPVTFEDCCPTPDPVVSVHNLNDRTIYVMACDNCEFQYMDIEVDK